MTRDEDADVLIVVPDVDAEPTVVLFDAADRPLVREIGFLAGLRPAR